jgi:hypothetical protein
MKTEYTIAARNVVFDHAEPFKIVFEDGFVFLGDIKDLKAWTIANKVGDPKGCFTGDGARHGVYPCLIAVNREMAVKLRLYMGVMVTEGDGVTFSTRKQAKDAARAIELSGVKVPAEALKWGVTAEPYGELEPRTKRQEPTTDEAPFSQAQPEFDGLAVA